jgi:hypothetical protein
MPTDCRLGFQERAAYGDSGSEIGHMIYPASGPLGGVSLRAASNLVYDHKYVYMVLP